MNPGGLMYKSFEDWLDTKTWVRDHAKMIWCKEAWDAATTANQSEIDRLRKINDELVKSNVSMVVMDYISEGLDLHYKERIRKLESDCSKLRECVEYYAEQGNWYGDDRNNLRMNIASKDTEGSDWVGGRYARETLKILEEPLT